MKRISFLLVILSVILSGCIQESDIQVEEVKEFRIITFSGSKIHCNADIEITNNYFLPLTIEDGELFAFAGDDKVGTVKLLKPIKLKSRTKQVYTMEFDITITQAITGLKSLINVFAGQKVSYQVKGTLKARQLLFSRKIEFSKNLDD